MIQNFAIDQAATFESLLFLSCEPKTAFGDAFRQETAKDGTPKWEAQLVARFRQFGKATNEIIKVGLVADRIPAEEIAPATPVELVGFEIGVMDKKDRHGNVTGAQVWYRCQEVRALTSAAPRQRRSEAAAQSEATS